MDILSCSNYQAKLSLEAFRNRFRSTAFQKPDSHLFSNLDCDRDGYITYNDILKAVHDSELPLNENDCRALMTKLDKGKTGSVNLGEFLRALSEHPPSFLDQIERTIVGVRRGGGTVYRKLNPRDEFTSRSQSTTTSSVMSITGAIQDKMRTYRPVSGRLDNFYDDLVVPRRNLPWEDFTKHTVQPCEWISENPQVMTDRARHISTNMAFGITGPGAVYLPMQQDKASRDRREMFNRSLYRSNSIAASRLASQREIVADDLDQRRLAYKSASIMDYHDRVGGKYCHVA